MDQGSESGTLVTLGPGTYSIGESLPISTTFVMFSGGCTKSGPVSATGAISAGEHQTC